MEWIPFSLTGMMDLPHILATLCGPILLLLVITIALVKRPPISARPVLRVALLNGVGCLGILLLFTKMAHEFYARHIFVLLISLALTLAWTTANSRLG